MERISLRGMGVALITPFKSTKEIDFEALARMTAHVINGKADYIVKPQTFEDLVRNDVIPDRLK